MRNVTVSLDEETYRRARVRAAELDSSLSALVRDYLRGLAEGGTEAERLAAHERELRAKIARFSAADRVSRDALHARSA